MQSTRVLLSDGCDEEDAPILLPRVVVGLCVTFLAAVRGCARAHGRRQIDILESNTFGHFAAGMRGRPEYRFRLHRIVATVRLRSLATSTQL